MNTKMAATNTPAAAAAPIDDVPALKRDLDTLRQRRDFDQTRVNELAVQLAAANRQIVELEALLEEVDSWREQITHAGLDAISREQLERLGAIVSGVDNAAVIEHDAKVRIDAFEQMLALVAKTTNDEALAGDIKRTWYEQALADVSAQLRERIAFESA